MTAYNKLWLEVSRLDKVYSTGSAILGTVRTTLEENYSASVDEIRISLVCKVDSIGELEVFQSGCFANLIPLRQPGNK